MLKYLIQLFIVYALLQYVFKIDINKMVAPYLGPVTELIDNNDLSLEDLSQNLLDGDMSSLLEGADLEQIQGMLNQDDLQEMLADKNISAEDAQEKIEQMKAQLQEKLDMLKGQ